MEARQRFLVRLAGRGLLQRLAVLHEASRDRPIAKTRLDRATAEQDPALMLRNAADDQARVLVVNRAAAVTDVARQVIARRNAQRDRRAALAAVLHGVGPGYGRGP